MNIKSILILTLLFVWFVLCWRYYTCNIKGFCGNDKPSTEEIVVAEVSAPLLFYPNTDSPIMDHFDQFRDSVCALSQTKKIDLIGYYSPTETNSTSYENLGLARANKLKELLSSCLNIANTVLKGEQNNEMAKFGDSYLATQVIPAQSDASNANDVQMVSHDGVTDITFPPGSSKEIESPALNDYLKSVAQNSKDKKITLTGYTDNTGTVEKNNAISLQRANAIKEQLVALGVSASNITTAGKGPENPVGDNSTPEGRAKNRRVELKID